MQQVAIYQVETANDNNKLTLHRSPRAAERGKKLILFIPQLKYSATRFIVLMESDAMYLFRVINRRQ